MTAILVGVPQAVAHLFPYSGDNGGDGTLVPRSVAKRSRL